MARDVATLLMSDGSFPQLLGKWKHLLHRQWEWFYNQELDIIVQHYGGEMWKFCPCPIAALRYTTRHSQYYARVRQWSANDLQGFVLASVQYEDDKILFLGTGPPLVSAQGASAEEFWKYIRSWGGEWLWEHVSTPCGLDEVVDAVAAGSAILMTDGSYSRNICSKIDGAGWLM